MIQLLMDVQVHSAITDGLRSRGVDVLTAQEDGSREFSDERLLDRAGELGRVLFTQDMDFLVEAARRQRSGVSFSGIIFGPQQRVSIKGCIEELELVAKGENPGDWINRVEYLPLK